MGECGRGDNHEWGAVRGGLSMGGLTNGWLLRRFYVLCSTSIIIYNIIIHIYIEYVLL